MSLIHSSLASLMKPNIASTGIDSSVASALALARSTGMHHMPVVDSRQLVGFVCTCDLYNAKMDASLKDVMKPPVTLERESTAEDAALAMREHGVGSVLVVDHGKLCGIVTRRDLLDQVPDSQRLMGPHQCACCGLTEHLRTDAHGQTLCVYCQERSANDGWFEMGESSG